MNNTINQARMNNSRPSFGSFSSEAAELINKKNIDRLVTKGISLEDLSYLRNHSLNIHVTKPSSSFYDGDGLFILNQNNNAKRIYASLSGRDRDMKLTPARFSVDSFGNFKYKIRDKEKTLPQAIKKALKVFRNFDAIMTAKSEYFAKFGSEINKLKSSIGHNEAVYNNNMDAFLSKIESSERDNSVELLKEIKKDKKQLKRYHEPEYFDKKQQKLFL